MSAKIERTLEELRAHRRAHPSASPAKKRENRMRYHYKLEPEDYQALLDATGGRCPICQNERRLVLDHDHSCCIGPVTCGECLRGLICDPCNSSLGWFEAHEDAIVAYLQKGPR